MSKQINILITLPMVEPLLQPLKSISPRLNFIVRGAKSATDIPHDIWQDTEVLYTLNVIPDLDMAQNLKWVQFHPAGIDDFMGSQLLNRPNIVTTTMSGIHAPVVGEYVLMMLLSQGHKLHEVFAYQMRGEWAPDQRTRFVPKELRGSTVGIVGYGSIGREVARLVTQFGARVLAIKQNYREINDSGFCLNGIGDLSGVLPEKIVSQDDLLKILPECDFIVISVPRTSLTMQMIGIEELNAMKPDVFIVDISRGGVIDHKALIEALKERKIGGAALDVFPEEPLSPNSPLWKLENVIISPHIAGISKYYSKRAMELFAANLNLYVEGKPLLNQFIQSRGY